ncbi:amidohydrolase family protein [Pelomonas sp. KK5]|uniref:amidohydrolase family protein n=1 Tax=Pelomonas sp. KK5 TaxID=1855730 RepID=UPI00097C9852|nr:amidohydrolase family protein [Pelomonas sp. KK5]
MRITKKQLFVAIAATLAAGLAAAGPDTTVLRNVTVVDTRSGALQPGRSVVIEQGRIARIVGARDAVAADARIIDGGGKFLVPGYLDMHVHSVPAAFGPAPALNLMLAHGITGVRQMNGSPELVRAARQFNAARAAGAAEVPEVLATAGAILAGVRSPADGVAAVQATKAMGADFVKVVSASPAALPAILAEAKQQALPVAGHLSPGLDALASAAGYRSIEHLGASPTPVQFSCSAEADAIRADLLAGKGTAPTAALTPTYVVSPFLYAAGDAPFVQQMMDSYDPARCDAVAEAVVARGAWQVPTLIRLHAMLQSDDASFREDPALRYVDPSLRGLWSRLGGEFGAMQPASARTTFHAFYESYVNMLRVLHRHGGAATTLTGSDTGGIWVVPGASLHREFAELAAAGFTPLEVLQATTLNGARFLHREATMGTVEVGRHADLVLLDADPTADARNLTKIAGVFNAGRYLSKAQLDAMKDGIAAQAAASPARTLAELIDASHKD